MHDETDPLTQNREVIIRLDPIDSWYPELYIRCFSGALELLIAWAGDAAFSEYELFVTVNHRIDDKPVESLVWTTSTNRGGTFFPPEMIMSLIQEMFNANEFVVQVFSDKSGRITGVFEPAGLYWAVKPALEACEVEVD